MTTCSANSPHLISSLKMVLKLMIQKAVLHQIIKRLTAWLNLGDITLVLKLEITQLRGTSEIIPWISSFLNSSYKETLTGSHILITDTIGNGRREFYHWTTNATSHNRKWKTNFLTSTKLKKKIIALKHLAFLAMCGGKWCITEMHNNELLLLANVQRQYCYALWNVKYLKQPEKVKLYYTVPFPLHFRIQSVCVCVCVCVCVWERERETHTISIITEWPKC